MSVDVYPRDGLVAMPPYPWYVVGTVSCSSHVIPRMSPHVVDQVPGHLAWFRGVMLGQFLIADAVSDRKTRTESSVATPIRVVHGPREGCEPSWVCNGW